MVSGPKRPNFDFFGAFKKPFGMQISDMGHDVRHMRRSSTRAGLTILDTASALTKTIERRFLFYFRKGYLTSPENGKWLNFGACGVSISAHGDTTSDTLATPFWPKDDRFWRKRVSVFAKTGSLFAKIVPIF